MGFYSKDEVIVEEIISKHVNDISGEKFNRWNVIGFAGLNKDLKSAWWCYCDCDPDKYYILVGTELTGQRTKSCGCLIKEENKRRSTLWESAYKFDVDKKTILRLHRIYNGMKSRCYNTLSKDFCNYGQRGIGVCDEWLLDIQKFEQWSFGNGYRDDLTIDRINVNGNYEPSNCRWISTSEQNRNKSTTVYVDYNGERRTLVSVLNENGIKNNYSFYRSRVVRYGWDIDKAISTPSVSKMKSNTISALINKIKETGKVNKKQFSNEYSSQIYKYLRDQDVKQILSINNIVDDGKGNLVYERN